MNTYLPQEAAPMHDDEDYMAQEDLRTLIEARKIRKDKERMKRVRECVDRKKKEMTAATGKK